MLPLADTTVLPPVSGLFLEARDRALLPDSAPAWTGTALVPAGLTVSISAVRLVAQSVMNGRPVVRLTHGAESIPYRPRVVGGHRQQVFELLPPDTPFRATAPEHVGLTVDLTLSVDRTGLSDGVLLARYTTETQPPSDGAAQRLRVSTTSGAGLPYLSIMGRLN